MDFLPIFLGYVMLFGMAAVLLLFSNSSPLLSSIVESIKCKITQIIKASIPEVVIRLVCQFIHYVFNTRNHVMQVTFGLLVLGGNTILMLDILPLLYVFEPDHNHILLPMIFLFSNLAAFHLSCSTDPGWVSSSNGALLASLYKADGVMFQQGTHCRTCKLIKPSRSKHCNICNRCVHRFDHHCIWTNNCVGAGNLRYFLPFLLTLLVMVVNGMLMGARSLYLLVVNLRMMESGYVDSRTGKVSPVTIPVLIQHLFMQHPRCVFLVSSLLMLTLLLGLFTVYHLFLVCCNQTTNERYKMADILNRASSSSKDLGRAVLGNSNLRQEQSSKQISRAEEQEEEVKEMGKSQMKDEAMNNSNKLSFDISADSNKAVNNSNKRNFDISVDSNKHMKTSGENVGLVNNLELSSVGSLKNMGGFYNRGIFLNLKEVFFPWKEYNSLVKELSHDGINGNGQKLSTKQKIKTR